MADQPQQPEQTQEERFRDAMKHILTVSKPEILRREAEDRERRTDAEAQTKEGQ